MNGVSIDMNALKKGEVNLGTSIMAVKFDGGIILGADSRTTTGAFIANRVTDKLTQVHDKIWCCKSGSAADTQAVSDIVHYHLQMYAAENGKAPSAKVAASIFQEITYSNKDSLTAGIIVAGFDERTGGEVYSVPLGGSLHKQDYAIAGSGSTFIYGYCDKYFRKGFTKDEAVAFVKTSLAEAIKWDGSSGGVIRMVILTNQPTERLIFYPDEYQNEYPNA
ncbi:similar to Saccharomyces cerevisiae YJL001W PRE3 Beta 1 subunit of the 20S proteasome, responsible for cleavage after acidic residues in peptides [Geotrichum candidum]|uniref:Proteasome subunit beta n=1 Tax=Geotrichum candidum TaxID=1173061 RepID=A0A0J9XIC9_GEOCN|nr:similar to Saccharomyces cerevisiae YJL001W PRE3 Beta 1 subunit of the 20S proteasome, responsible for cleavage after acidic residues in peptides [Geotrichum candidum]